MTLVSSHCHRISRGSQQRQLDAAKNINPHRKPARLSS